MQLLNGDTVKIIAQFFTTITGVIVGGLISIVVNNKIQKKKILLDEQIKVLEAIYQNNKVIKCALVDIEMLLDNFKTSNKLNVISINKKAYIIAENINKINSILSDYSLVFKKYDYTEILLDKRKCLMQCTLDLTVNTINEFENIFFDFEQEYINLIAKLKYEVYSKVIDKKTLRKK